MFSHVVIGTNNLEASRRFYDAVLGALGYDDGVADCSGLCRRYVYRGDTGLFIISTPRDGQPAIPANGGTIGFGGRSTIEVDQWHDAGLANGGKSIEDPPGVRDTQIGSLYLAYLRDPDGNKLCALYRMWE